MENVILYKRPKLNRPYLVAAFAGWPDAGKVATGTVDYLKNKLKAKKLGEIKPDDFYDFSSSRPLGTIKDGLLKELKPPSNEFFFWKNQRSIHDLLIFLGTEPNLRWNDYVNSLLEVMEQFGAKRIYALGGDYASIPHTKESISVMINTSNSSIRKELEEYGIDLVQYQGPVSVHTYLLKNCQKKKKEAISLWGNAPHYVRGWNSRISYALLKRLIKMLDIEINLEDIKSKGKYLEEEINRLISQEPKFQEYIKRLEKDYEVRRISEDKDQLIKEIEEFLRKQEN